MTTMKKMLLLSLVLTTALLAGLGAAPTVDQGSTIDSMQAGRCLCPQIYAPVLADDGNCYPNQCIAECKNKTVVGPCPGEPI